jgi:hypothetical protein
MFELNDEVRWILGRPNFWCASAAQGLRKKGHQIKTRAEDEQAAVIHFMLTMYEKHGEGWRDHAIAYLTGGPKHERPTMPMYRKKPVVIEAIRLPGADEDATDDVVAQLHHVLRDATWASERDGALSITTLEGTMLANPGDWVIRGIKGECYPCKNDIFEATYEPVQPEE